MNLGEDELTIAHRIGEKLINAVHNRKIYFKPTRKQLSNRILYASRELNLPFYVNYYLIHIRSKINNTIRQLKINYHDKIKEQIKEQ